MLNGSDCFGENGFDFAEVIRVDHWKQERVDLMCLELLQRILRKNTELFQEMEDTLYRYCDIYRELKKRDDEVKISYRAQAFTELLGYGVILADDEEYEWSVQINSRGGSQELITFGRWTTARMEGLEKNLFADGLKLAIVYRRFLTMLDDKEIDLTSLTEVKNDLIEKMSDKQIDQLVDSKVGMMEQAIEQYDDLFGSAKDPVDEMMERYKLDDSAIDEVEQIAKFYEVVKETSKNL